MGARKNSCVNTARIAQRGRAEPAFTEKLRLRGAAQAIQREVPPGEAVFHASWAVFTQLFFLAPTHDYVVGLDPTFFAVHDPALYRRYELLRTGRDEQGQPLTRPERIIREEFGMAFALVLPAVEHRLAFELRRAHTAGRITLRARHPKDRWRLYDLRPPR